MKLIRYDAMCLAILEATRVDEVKEIRDKAIALQAYAKQAKNKDAEAKCAVIRLRAERRVGEMIAEQRDTVGLPTGGDAAKVARGKQSPEQKPTLAAAGIDKDLAKQARKLAAMSDTDFRIIEDETSRAVTKASRNVVKQKTKKADRTAKEIKLGQQILALPDRRFGVLGLDPPWKLENYSDETGMDRAAENHYPTMSLAELKQLDVASLAARHSSMWMWATSAFLDQAIDLMRHYGFQYKGNVVWKKTGGNPVMGRIFINMHEILLYGTQGNVPAPVHDQRWPSVIEAPVGAHSEKPEDFYQLIEAYFPTLPKIELFARKARPGWDSWGNEAPDDDIFGIDDQAKET